MLTAHIVRSREDLESLKSSWDQLLARHPNPQFFYTHSWHLALVQSGIVNEWACVAVHREGQVVGLLPLAGCDGGCYRMLGHGFSDYNDMLCADAEPTAVFDCAWCAIAGDDRAAAFDFENVREDSLLLGALRQSALRSRLIVERLYPAPAITGLNQPAVMQDLLKRKSLVRHVRGLRKLGDVTFRHLERTDEMEQSLPDFMDQLGGRMMLRDGFSEQRFEHLRRLYKTLISIRMPDLRFSVVEVSGKAVAYHLGFEYAGTFYWYKPAFDIDWSDKSPGEVLLWNLFHEAAGRAYHTFDFTIGDEAFKSRFANFKTMVYGCRTASRLHVFLRRWGAAARPLRPVAWPAQRIARGSIGLMRRVFARIRSDGAARSAWRAVRAVARLLFERRTILLFRQDFSPAMEAMEDPYKVSETGMREFARLLRPLTEEPFGSYLLRRALQRRKSGDTLYVTHHGIELVHAAWCGWREHFDAAFEMGPGARIPLVQPGWIIYDCRTPAAWRRKGIYTKTLRQLVALKSRDGHPVWIYCEEDNHASARGIQSAGFTCIQRLTRYRVLGRWGTIRGRDRAPA